VTAHRGIDGSKIRHRTRLFRSAPALLGALLAFACSDLNVDHGRAGPLETEIPVATAGRGGAEQGGAGAEQGGAPGVPDNTDVPAEDDWVGHDILRQRVMGLIDQHCVSCHDEPDRGGSVPGVTQIEWLVTEGWLTPGSSDDSPLLVGFQNGHAQLGRRGPTIGEVALVKAFVDQLAFAEGGCQAPDYLDTDAALATMARDIASLPAGDRPFTRYLSVAYASNDGGCGWALEDERQALFAAVNGVSTAEAISAPVPIEPSELIYRVDVRNYAWDRPIDIDGDGGADVPEGSAENDGTDFPDGWSAIVAAAEPFAVEYTGPEADVLRLEAQTPVPFLPVNAFVHSVGAGDLYYALLGIGRDLHAERLALGIDLYADREGSSLLWAGFVGREREVTLNRAPQSRPDRGYWMAAEQDTGDAESIYDTLFDWEPANFQIIFHLPNGLQAYAIDVDGLRANETVIHRSCRAGCPDGEPLGLAACPACHGEGLLPIDNQLRAEIDASPDPLTAFFPFTDYADLQRYPTSAELDALRQADDAVHRDARARAGLIPDRPAPLSGVYYEFERTPLDARRAAAELGVRFESWTLGVEQLEPRLAALGSPAARIDRRTFGELFAGAQCQLSVGARNRPAGCP
jgi:hypothetical protein